MLEEALNKKDESPKETSLALLSFFRQEYPLGGSQARFVRFFPTLNERIFGPITIDIEKKGPDNRLIIDAQQFETLQAAWLARKRSWNVYNSNHPSSNSATSNHRLAVPPGVGNTLNGSSSTMDIDPVVSLLQRDPILDSTLEPSSFIHILEKEYNASTQSSHQLGNYHRFPFPFFSLSLKMQMELLNSVMNPSSTSVTPTSNTFLSSSSAALPASGILGQGPMKPKSSQPLYQNANRILILCTLSLTDQQEILFTIQRFMNTHATNSFIMSQPNLSSPFHTGPSSNEKFNPLSILQIINSSSTSTINTTATNSEEEESLHKKMTVGLSLWLYYFISFLRYPWILGDLSSSSSSSASTTPSSSSISGFQQSHGTMTPYGEVIYFQLLQSYIKAYCPHVFIHSSKMMTLGNTISPQYHHDDEQSLASSYHDTTKENQRNELFLRLALEYWLERNHIYTKTTDAISYYQQEKNRVTTSTAVNTTTSTTTTNKNTVEIINPLFGLESSYDFAQLFMIASSTSMGVSLTKQQYTPPPRQVQRSIRILLEHLVCDPALTRGCLDNRLNMTDRGKNEKQIRYNKNDHAMSDINSMQKPSPLDWPLPPHHTLATPLLYNYIRTALRYAPVHTRNSSFYTALDLWLMWIEPWNVVTRRGSINPSQFLHQMSDRVTGSSPIKGSNRLKSDPKTSTMYNVYIAPTKPTSPCKYTSSWESYIVSNLYIYLVPFAIFIRRAAQEFDFSKNEFHKSLLTIQRVFRVFSSVELLKALDKTVASISNDDSDLRSELLLHHEDVLGEYCPRTKDTRCSNDELLRKWSLESVQGDMHNLMEEILLQQRKAIGEQNIFDRMVSRIENLFGEGPGADYATLDKLVSSAKQIVKFPRDYEFLPKESRKSFLRSINSMSVVGNNDTGSNIFPDRDKNGLLTKNGREQLLKGEKVCNPLDIASIGDPMYSRPKSYEISLLVDWSILISEFLNNYFGFSSGKRNEPVRVSTSSETPMHEKTILLKLLKEGEESRKALFRFNFRFLADSRNIFTAVIISFLWRFFTVKG